MPPRAAEAARLTAVAPRQASVTACITGVRPPRVNARPRRRALGERRLWLAKQPFERRLDDLLGSADPAYHGHDGRPVQVPSSDGEPRALVRSMDVQGATMSWGERLMGCLVRSNYLLRMISHQFDTFDEILLRLSDIADDERVRQLATTEGLSRLGRLMRSLIDTERLIVASLRQKIERRSAGALGTRLVA